jgi:hypothetical protein
VSYAEQLEKLKSLRSGSAKSAKTILREGFGTFVTPALSASENFSPQTDDREYLSPGASWRAIANRFHTHMAVCRRCYAPRGRYCAEGWKLRAEYLNAYLVAQNATATKKVSGSSVR